MNIVSALQARIKRRSNDIFRWEQFLCELSGDERKAIWEHIEMLRFDQILDKRLMGQLVRLTRSRKALMRIVAGE